MNKSIQLLLAAAAGCFFLTSLVAQDAAQHNASSTKPIKDSTDHLPNLIRLHPKVISGGLPAGEPAFQELAALGIKTIISVDGAKPDVEIASKYGLRYVHLPHGYDGIPETRVQELAKAVRDLEGPIYIHCHHGKHRSPAAATVACVSAGLIPHSEAVAVLELAGTSPSYRGLFKAAEAAHPIDPAVLDELNVAFSEVAVIPPMAEAMVALEHAHEHMEQIIAAGWKTPVGHADLDPQHEALLLRELYTELLRTDEVQSQDAAFRQYMQQSEQAARKIEMTLESWTFKSGTMPPAVLDESAKLISDHCKACHVDYRDNR